MEIKKDITELVRSFEDGRELTGRPDVPDFLELPEDMREYFKAHYKMVVIAEALNEGWKADWNNVNQEKWIPVFYNDGSSSGFVFYVTYYYCSGAGAGRASRLCFATEALARFAGKMFIEIWDDILMK